SGGNGNSTSRASQPPVSQPSSTISNQSPSISTTIQPGSCNPERCSSRCSRLLDTPPAGVWSATSRCTTLSEAACRSPRCSSQRLPSSRISPSQSAGFIARTSPTRPCRGGCHATFPRPGWPPHVRIHRECLYPDGTGYWSHTGYPVVRPPPEPPLHHGAHHWCG